MEEELKDNEKIKFRNSEILKPTTENSSSTRISSNSLSQSNESPHSGKIPYKSLLDMIRTDSKAKLWQCILTSIISINDFCEKAIKKDLNVKEILEDPLNFMNLCQEKQKLTMLQTVFNKGDSEKESMIQITSHSNPLRRLDSRDQKHKLFIEKSLRNEKKIDLSMNFKIKEYSYELFSVLRSLNAIKVQDIKESFDIEKNFNFNISNTSELFGKSGATFFFSNDNKYVLKSISKSHAKNFITTFPKFFSYLLNNNDDSIMVKIYGLYKISVQGFDQIYFILMENLMEHLADHLILRVYDLKGSKFQRNQGNFKMDIEEQNKIIKSIFGENLKENLQDIEDTFVTDQILIVRGKDCDFIESEDVFISVKKEDKTKLIENLQKDVTLFEECNLMDYSLIFIKALKNPFIEKKISLEENNNKNGSYKRFRNYESPCKKYIYSLAIVDFLQNYDILKQIETQFKSIFKEKPQEISCVDAHFYKERFLKFIISVIQSDSF